MSNQPDDPSKDPEDNPFKGTPFEQIFGAFGGAAGQGGAGMPDLSALMGQMQAMMTPYDGPVNWQLATDIARRTSAQEPDPSPDRGDQGRGAVAMRLADQWLDEATVLPSGVTTTAAWSRADWIEQTTEGWKGLVGPGAGPGGGAMGGGETEAEGGRGGRAGGRARRRRHGRGDARGGAGHGGAADRDDQQGRWRTLRQPGGLGTRWSRRRGAHRQRHRAA